MPTISFFEVEPWEKDYLTKAMQQVDRKFVNGLSLTFCENTLTQKNVTDYKDAQILSIFIFTRITKQILDALPNLKHINTMSTGFDHIDLAECARRNITVSNVPSYGENTVAEHAFALLLSLSRKIVPSVMQTRRGKFDTGPALRGFDLKGKTIGVIGTGRIGRNAIKYAKGFDMNVVAFDAFPSEQAAKDLGFTYEKDLNKFLGMCDILTLHAPELPSTHHMINMKNVDMIKRGCVLINTARGGLIETRALVHGLNTGIFSALGLDVFEEETGMKNEKSMLDSDDTKADMKVLMMQHTLLEYDNVIITPHNAFNSSEALTRILDTSVQNVGAFLQRAPTNLVKTQ